MQTITAPDTIPLSKIRDFLADLGIDLTDVREFSCGVDGVYVEMYARDADGRFYVADNEIAMHRISIPLDRDA